MFLKSFFRRISDDLKIKKLIPLKILFFVHASTMYVLYPYLTIHMRELGINVEEAAIMSAVTPIATIVMPPLAGMLADKIGNFKLLLALASMLGSSALLLLAVPVGRVTITFPAQLDLLATCTRTRLQLATLQPHVCKPLHPYSSDVNLTVQSCGFICDLPRNLSDIQVSAIRSSNYYGISLHSANGDETAAYRYFSSPRPQTSTSKPQHGTRVLTNDIGYSSSVREVTETQLFFPSKEIYHMSCSVDGTNVSCSFSREGSVTEVRPAPEYLDSYMARVSHEVETQKDDVKSYTVEALNTSKNNSHDPDYDGVDSVQCNDGFIAERIRVSAWSGPVETRLDKCVPGCVATVARSSLCENQSQLLEIDPILTFWAYLAVRVFVGIISGTSFAMFEGAVIAILRDQQADYGLQRIYGSIGGMISSPLSGILIDYASRGKESTDFRPAFYLYAALKLLSGAIMLSIDLHFKQPAQDLIKDVLTVFRNVEIVALFIVCFIMGTAWGYIETFLFWLLQDLGASQSLMGVTITVGCIAGLPLLVMSGPIIRRLGHANVLFIGFVFYAIRLFGYSIIYNPWLCLVFEALESITSALTFTAAVTYAARLSSSSTDTSVQGLLGGIYFGVGKGVGSLVGGYLTKFFGTRPTYQIFSAFTLLTGCIYYLFNMFYLRKRPQKETNDIYKKKPKLQVNLEVVAERNEEKRPEKLSADVVASQDKTKLAVDSTDGGSDSGVDNASYNADGEHAPPAASNSNKNVMTHDKI